VVRAGVAGAGRTSKRVLWSRMVDFHVTFTPNVGIYVVGRPPVLCHSESLPILCCQGQRVPIVSGILLLSTIGHRQCHREPSRDLP
jgi:hypothetical protein